MATADNLIELAATEAVAAMQRGDITAEAYATALLARAQQCADLNAFRTIAPDRVLEAARAADRSRSAGATLGPMHGLPIAVKDSVNTADYPTSQGTGSLRDFRPKADADVLKPLKAAGAIVMGKTNLHELSFGWTSNNECFGSVHNPHDRTRIPGGSSGELSGCRCGAHCPAFDRRGYARLDPRARELLWPRRLAADLRPLFRSRHHVAHIGQVRSGRSGGTLGRRSHPVRHRRGWGRVARDRDSGEGCPSRPRRSLSRRARSSRRAHRPARRSPGCGQAPARCSSDGQDAGNSFAARPTSPSPSSRPRRSAASRHSCASRTPA